MMKNVLIFGNIELNGRLNSEELEMLNSMHDSANEQIRESLRPENLASLKNKLNLFLLENDSGWNENFESIEAIESLTDDLLVVWQNSSDEMLKFISLADFVKFLTIIRQYHELFWDFDTIDFFNQLDDDLVVYRGGEINDENLAGLSWTLEPDIAAGYAERKGHEFILKGELKKDNVLLISSLEKEIIPKMSTVLNVLKINSSKTT